MVATLTFRSLLVLCTATVTVTSAEYFEGDGTTYTLGEVSSGNCNFMSSNSIAPMNYAALNAEQWNNLSNCGRCAQVSCIDSRCVDTTASAIVQIVDQCPECKHGDLDLSHSVFRAITGSDPSRFTIRWQFVDCPDPETVKICLKNGANGYWLAVQPTNSLVGVQSISINNQATTMLDGAYYYLVTSSTGVDLNAVNVSVTSIYSDVIEGTYILTSGQCTDTYQQFPSPTTTTWTAATTEAPITPADAPTASPTYAPAVTTSSSKCYVRHNRN
ncbi:unnamed protein product [Phytophthora lilii]|uniref:Unnamed protein product n=1 Tax=Phytophthora lilii TaxID=2077276 RepID=A0A9W6X5A1_9STRA|nr:unnamed protein product [Phytophthora lilii]